MKLDALDHPKTFDLAARLGVELPTAIGYLELLWSFTAQKTPQGNIGKWPNGSIARACYWMADPDVFVSALEQSRLIDVSAEHRYIVHDWHEHAPMWVRAKLKKAGLPFYTTKEASSVPSIVPSIVPTKEATREPSTREGKGREELNNIRASGDALAGFNSFWLTYPKKKSKGQAEKAWKKINPDEQLHDRILRALERAKTSAEWKKDGGQFIPYPASWLNAKGWEDEFDEPRRSIFAGAK